MNKRQVAIPIAVAAALIAGVALTATPAAPALGLAPGTATTISCALPLSITAANGTSITLSCPSAAPGPPASPTATPSPTPTPTSFPTPTPSVGAGVPVPASIDPTGRTDVAAALAAFINGLAPNTTVQFPAGATYAVASAIKIGGRTNLDLEGNGATIRSIAASGNTNENYSDFYFQTFPGTNTGISVHGFKLIGSDPTPNTFVGGKEGQMGVLVDGGSGFDISGNTFSNSWGDGVEVNSGASNVHVHGNMVLSAGRNALSVIWGNHVEFDHNTITRVGYVTFDVEPNNSGEPCSFINIHDNTAGPWGDAFFALDGSHTGAAIHDVTVSANVVAGGSLLAIVNNGGTTRNQNIVFTNNSSNMTAGGPVLNFAHVDGLTVTGNVQPLSSGALLSITDSTNVVHQ